MENKNLLLNNNEDEKSSFVNFTENISEKIKNGDYKIVSGYLGLD